MAAYACTQGWKRIRLSEEACGHLVARKGQGETVSDVLLRLSDERSLLDLARLLTGEQAKRLEDAIEERCERRHAVIEAVAIMLDEPALT